MITTFNKKGMLDDVFDLLALVIIPVFGLLFLNLALNQNIINSHQASLENVQDFRRLDSAISNIRIQLQSGETIEPEEIDKLIAESKVLGGRVITNCRDYRKKEDCAQDIVGLHKDSAGKCLWEEESRQCVYFMPVEVRR